jgi:hypothetical protein
MGTTSILWREVLMFNFFSDLLTCFCLRLLSLHLDHPSTFYFFLFFIFFACTVSLQPPSCVSHLSHSPSN